MGKPGYSFDRDAAVLAAEAWGFNCGPAALATLLGMTPKEIKPAMERVGFLTKGYTNPRMMAKAIGIAGGQLMRRNEDFFAADSDDLQFPACGLARIQWTGPWTAPGANPRWAYRQTHWVASWREQGTVYIFDVNGGFRSQRDWEAEIVPLILRDCVPRNDGGWFITHSWEVSRG